MANDKSRYSQLIERIFLDRYQEGANEVPFERSDIVATAGMLGIVLPKNLGDVVYSFRYRTDLPPAIVEKAKGNSEWIIRSAGRGRYKLVLTNVANFSPNPALIKIKILDSTPGVVVRYSFDDEQALLAKIRYNRLIDIFTGVTCYSLQNHLRTTVTDMGQVETDEVYIGVDKLGAHHVFPVQAKGGNDRIGAVQIEQDFMVCAEKYPQAIGRPIAAQFMDDSTIVLFEFRQTDEGVRVLEERHYLLVHPDDLSPEELAEYRKRV